jgi:hypothetical protein
MIKFIIIGSFCMYLLFYHPGWVLLAGLIAGGLYILRQYDLAPVKDSKDDKSNLSDEDGLNTYEKREEGEMSRIKFKEGFQDDPKWQALAKKVGQHVERVRELEEAAFRAEAQNIKNMQ